LHALEINPEDSLAIQYPARASQLSSTPPIAASRHLDCKLLNRVSQRHLLGGLRSIFQKAVISGSAHVGRVAQPGYRFVFVADFLVDGPLPLSGSCCSSKLRNSFFRKSISIVIWPTFRSSSASRLSASIRLPCPENAF